MSDRNVSPVNVMEKLSSLTPVPHVATARRMHMAAIFLALNQKLRFAGKPLVSVVNVQQSVYRGSPSTNVLPTLTPSGSFYLLAHRRCLSTLECLVSMCFPVAAMDVGANTDGELKRMVGNSMHCRAFGAVFLAAMAIVDERSFKRSAQGDRKRKLQKVTET